MIRLPPNPRLTLGILTLYQNGGKSFEERSFLEKMIEAGEKLNVQIIVFTPEDFDPTLTKVKAHLFKVSASRWTRSWVAVPNFIYDRCRSQKSPRFKKYLQFREKNQHRFTFLNSRLANKWTVHQVLTTYPRMDRFLPETFQFSTDSMFELLNRYPSIYIKPSGGTGGRGILRVSRKTNGFYVQGRDQARRIVTPKLLTTAKLVAYTKDWTKNQHFIVQQGINIALVDDKIHDYRVLVQKDGSGDWQVTGMVGKVGGRDSITSNLHGGGEAMPLRKLLYSRFSRHHSEQIIVASYQLALIIADHLEKKFGRLCELGLDLAIDEDGDVWLLEVNPKPSREVFARIKDWDGYQKAIRSPIEYALYLAKR